MVKVPRRASALQLFTLTAPVVLGCFDRKPGDDRLPRDAGTAFDLRLVQPAHGAAVTHRRPVVRWRSSAPSLAWSIEFCADALCERVLQRTSTADVAVAPTADLPSGLVFWRVIEPTRAGVTSRVRWFNVPRGLPMGAASGTGAVMPATQFDGDADGRPELLDANGALHRTDDTKSFVGSIVRDDVSHTIAAGDVDGDGAPDLAAIAGTAAPAQPSVIVWRGPIRSSTTAPTWRVPLPESFPPGATRSFALTTGDLDGDGFRDLIVSSIGFQQERGQIHIFAGSSRGPSAADIQIVASPRGLHSRFRAIEAADLDGDGCDDLLTAATGDTSAYAGLSAVYRGTPSGLDPLPVWENARVAGDNDHLGTSGAIADVNGDGNLDVVLTALFARGGQGCVYVFPWSPDARTLTSDPSSASCGDGAQAINRLGDLLTLGDFDGDGHADAVVLQDSAERDLLWLARGGRGGLDEGALTRLTAAEGAFGITRISGLDFDGDGFSDLLVENTAGGRLRLTGSSTGLRSFAAR